MYTSMSFGYFLQRFPLTVLSFKKKNKIKRPRTIEIGFRVTVCYAHSMYINNRANSPMPKWTEKYLQLECHRTLKSVNTQLWLNVYILYDIG